mmetsp:Transcript_27173/g.83414  ORF Transcript_27173/g.83414 Transcript_27173/m.83414 type:complete len:437 (-) Transcript_27173:143-1453(-)
MVRERKMRDFKDDFKPADRFEGEKEGYYFSTGSRGTGACVVGVVSATLGYYLDAKAADLNDPDEEGYVLVRAAPAVAVHRAMPKREAAQTQGLLFSPALLAALGPSYGEPAHRYKLVTAPWMGGMRPPKETFEAGAEELGQDKVYGRNELLHERYEYLAERIARLEGRRRRPQHQQADDDDDKDGAERRELALLAPSDVVTVEARGGPLQLSGDELLPVPPRDGPWTFLLELGGPDAARTPFAFKATLKQSSLRWPAAKLLRLFADQHAAKFSSAKSLDAERLRLHVSDAEFAASDALLAELVTDWTGPVAARLVVKTKLGAGADATQLASARATALRAKRELQVDDWSSQEQLVKARSHTPYKGPMTSEEIRDYWEQHKDDKHWRTDAALRGYATTTDDAAKLEEWKTKRLVKKKGFLNNTSAPGSGQNNRPLYP